jgi:hypothetical protein
MLTVEGAPPSRTIAIEVAVNISGAALRKKSGVMGLQLVSENEGQDIVEHVKRWIKHGFDPYTSLTKDIANAYFDLLPGATQQRRQNLGIGWQTSFVRNNKELSELFKEPKFERVPERIQRGHQNDSAEKFFSIYRDFKLQHLVATEDVHALAEAAYRTSVYKKTNLVFGRPKRTATRAEERQFSSVIHCCSSRGRHLLPYIVCRSKDPPQTRVFRTITISSNESGWAEYAHALDWLRNIFEPKTRPLRRSDGSLRWRILLVPRRFSVSPEFEQYCWKKSILCLPFPQNDQKFFNPMENIALGAMKASYTDTMMQKFVDKQNVSMEVEDFARWIQGEIKSSKRAEEATEYWRKSCLIPLDEDRLRNCLQGKRPTAVPDETDSIANGGPSLPRARSRSSMAQTPITSCTPSAGSTPRTSVSLPILPTIEVGKRDSTIEPSYVQFPNSQQEDIEPSTNDHTESDSSSDNESEIENDSASVSHISQSVTPSRTPRRPKTAPKTPKSARPKSLDSEPSCLVMSAQRHCDTLDGCLDGTPRTRKRLRDALMIDRCELEKENAQLKAKVDILTKFMSVKKQRID